jgi:histidinol-phosphate aminotransferase
MNPACLKIKAYRVPQAGCPVKLNQNESPYDVPPEIKERVLNELRRLPWNRYPSLDDRALRDRIARYAGFPPRGIVPGNSSNEIIQAVIVATCESADKMVVVEPGFSIYARLGLIFGRDVRSVPLGKDFRHEPDAIIACGRDARLVMLASPNNPTGTGLTIPQIEKICRSLRGYLVVDEAYFEFSGRTCLPLIEKYERLMVIRTFSKAFGLAGLRLGYLLARPRIAAVVSAVKLPFSVGIMQPAAAWEILDDPDRIRLTVNQIVREREKLSRGLKQIPGVKTIPSRTNFLLFQVAGRSAGRIFAGLKQKGVLIRCFETPALKDWLRVTVGRPEENEIFLKKLKLVLEVK